MGDVLGGPVYVGRYPRPEIIACERRFRSFDPLTGTYTSYTGEQVLCPISVASRSSHQSASGKSVSGLSDKTRG